MVNKIFFIFYTEPQLRLGVECLITVLYHIAMVYNASNVVLQSNRTFELVSQRVVVPARNGYNLNNGFENPHYFDFDFSRYRSMQM